MPLLSEFTETQVWLAEKSKTSFLVALWLAPEIAEKLVVTSGEAAEALHVTLALCGEAEELDELTQARVVTAIDDVVRYRDRLTGKVSGYGRFGEPESDDPHVFYATPDVPRLAELRQDIVNCLLDKGVPVSTNHGWTPHITLAYLESGAANPADEVPALDLEFDGVIVMAGARRIDIPFWKPEPSVYMSESFELPLEAPLDSRPARALYFGSFDKEWIPFLPKPGTYTHDQYGQMNLTSEAYEQMLKNFDDYVYKQDLPIRATHTAPEAGAVGWIKPGGMRIASDGSLEVKPEWNELGQGLVEGDRFKYVSAEFCKTWTNPVTQEKIQNVAVGLALVTRPHFKTDVLNPLSESEALAFAEAGEAREGTPMPELQDAAVVTPPVVPAVVAPVVATPPAVDAQVVVATPPAVDQALVLSDLTQITITAETRRRERQMFSDLNTRVELAERERDNLKVELAELKHKALVDKFTNEVTGRSVENDKPWFGDPKANIAHLVSLAEAHGEESQEVRWTLMQKRNEAIAIQSTGLFDPISVGTAGSSASAEAQVARLSEQLMAVDKTLTPEQAANRIYEENPELYIKSLKK